MKKSTLFLSLLLGIGGMASASAQVTIPQTSVEGSTTYEYFVRCAGNQTSKFASTNVGSNNAVMFSETASDTKLKIKLVPSGDAGLCKIYATNLPEENTNTLIGCTGTANASTVTYYATDGNGAQNAEWTVAANTVTATMNGYTPYYSICPGTSDLSWNPFGGANTNQLFTRTGANSNWNFIPANAEALKKTAQDIAASLENVTAPTGFRFDETKREAVNTLLTKVSADDYTYAESDATTLISTYSEILTNGALADLTSGYYYLVNKTTDRYPYMFNDDFYASNTGKYTLTAQEAVTTANGVWKITVDGNTLTVLNGQGTGITVGSSNALTTLHIDGLDTTGDGYYYFTEALNATNGNFAVGDYRRLDFWTTGGASDINNRWKFENVADATEANIYTVAITGLNGNYVAYAHDGITEHAYNNGFFLVTDGAAPEISELTPSSVTGYDAAVAVNDHVINVTYTKNALGYYNDITALLSEAETALGTRGVGYPTTSSTVYTTLSTAIETAKTITESNGSAEALNALQTALNNYKAASTDIQMPEEGKAYAFVNINQAGTKRYMNYAESGYAMAEYTTTDALPETAILVCRKLADGQYVFVNNAGKYFLWKGGVEGHNDNKGYRDDYNEEQCTITIGKLLSTGNGYVSGDDADFFGCMYIRGLRTNGAQNYFVIASNGTYDQAPAPYFNASFSSAFLIEEVSYPNTVRFNAVDDIEGVDGIATFSAPFATVLPENVTAYVVSTTGSAEDGTDQAVMTEIQGEAIPASTGVLLAGQPGTTATLLPVTTETPATISGTLLGNSAGVAKTIAADDNAYILTRVVEPRYLKLDVSRGASNQTSNGGCYFAFSEITLANSTTNEAVTLTFNCTNTSANTMAASDVAVTATSGVVASLIGVTTSDNSNNIHLGTGSGSALKTQATLLSPNVNIGNGGSASFTFLLENMPAETTFDKAAVKLYGVNSVGDFQPATNCDRYFDVTLSQGEDDAALSSFATYTDINIVTGIGSEGKVWDAAADNAFSTGTGAVAFYPAVEGSVLSMNKAYLEWAGDATTLKLALKKGDVTAIESATADDNRAMGIYDLTGRRVEKPVKGLYIVNGKKVYVK